MEKFYVTTPIYYVNDVPHVGHAYSTIAADILARFNRALRNDVFFLTGTDEHGQKVAKAAETKGLDPKAHVDKMAEPFKGLWQKLNIKYDDFIRTTEARHEKVVQAIFQKLYDKGDVYAGHYEGWYCVHEETFFPESQLVDGKCPDCDRKVEWLKEESYHFKTSKYMGILLEKIKSNEFQILPETRKNEVISFIEGGVEDVSVSRTSFDWGIPVPFDKGHVVYVWFDALINYLTGIGYHPDEAKQDAKFKAFWPADVHIIGKDILKFHAVIWPAMLMALDVPLPKMVFAHGFLTLGEEKISKSKGIVVDPIALVDKYGADAFRYFFMSEVTFGLDGEYSEAALIKRLNYDLANDLGNLVHRTANMMKKYFDGEVPGPTDKGGTLLSTVIRDRPKASVIAMRERLKLLDFKSELESIWAYVGHLNKFIEEAAPWNLKKEEKDDELATVMYTLAEGIRIIAQLIYPFMPTTAQKIWEQIGMAGNVEEAKIEDASRWGVLPEGSNFKVTEPLFPRIEE